MEVRPSMGDSTKMKKILIIDDERDYAQIVGEGCAIGQIGPYKVKLETRASRALQTALDYRPDLIILDIVMPEVDGVELASEMHAHPMLKHVPLTFITASLAEEVLNRYGGKVDGYPCLLKPFSIPALVQFVQNAINHPQADPKAA